MAWESFSRIPPSRVIKHAAYKEIGGTLKRRYDKLVADRKIGGKLWEDRKSTMLREADRMIPHIYRAVHFLSRVGWLEADQRKQYEKEIMHVGELLSFYQTHRDELLPESERQKLQKKLDTAIDVFNPYR